VSNKKIRIFAGPNGSGKSTLQKGVEKNYPGGFFINADQLEVTLKSKKLIDLNDFDLVATQNDLDRFKLLPDSISLFEKALQENNHQINITLTENCIVDHSEDGHTYEGSFIASFLRSLMMQQNKSFSFESVFSHPSKILEIKDAIQKGYRIYLYFVCIDSPELNILRIQDRVKKQGHDVDNDKVRERYYRTLGFLNQILPLCYRAYLFDNSGKEQILFSELYKEEINILSDSLPSWFIEYVLPYYAIE